MSPAWRVARQPIRDVPDVCYPNTDQQMALRRAWSSRTNPLRWSGSSPRCRSRSAASGSGDPTGLRRLHRLDRVGRRTEVVLGHVAHARGLASGVRREPRRPPQRPGRTHRVPTARAGLHHLHLPARPRPRRFDRLPRTSIRGNVVLEEWQHPCRTARGPDRQGLVVGVCERPAAADGDEAGVADAGQDHLTSVPAGHLWGCSRSSGWREQACRCPRRGVGSAGCGAVGLVVGWWPVAAGVSR